MTDEELTDHGLFGLGASRLYVHRGLGFYGFPLRIGVPGEASVLEKIRVFENLVIDADPDGSTVTMSGDLALTGVTSMSIWAATTPAPASNVVKQYG